MTQPTHKDSARKTMSTPKDSFRRERRYLVVKLKDATEYLAPEERDQLERLASKCGLARIDAGKKHLECVVVESDWPEYEPTWKAIERRVAGERIWCAACGKWGDHGSGTCPTIAHPSQPTPTDSGEERRLPLAVTESLKVAICYAPQLNDLPAGYLRPLLDRMFAAIKPHWPTPPQPSADEKQETPEFDEAHMWNLRQRGDWTADATPNDRSIAWAYDYIMHLEKERDKLRASERAATARAEAAEKERDQARAEVKSLQEELGLKLAACDCAAMLDTESTHGENREVVRGNPAWSPAFESVMRRTAECLALRADLATLKARCEGMEKELAMVLKDWNDIVKASGAPTHGTAIARVAQLREDKERLGKELTKLKGDVKRFLVPWAPHLPESWRTHLEGVIGERLFLGIRDAARQSAGSGEGKV